MFGQTYDRLWKEVDKAQQKSLPQTVIQLSQEIFRKAKAEQNSPQMLKAYLVGAQHQAQLTPDSVYSNLKGMEQWVSSTTNSMDCAILHTLLAMQYSNYVSQNYWQLRQRTDVVDEPSDDIREWTSNMFLEKIMHHAQAALEDSVVLLNASTKEYLPFMIMGDASKYYHHDMYHVLARYNTNALKTGNLNADLSPLQLVSRLYNRLIDTYKTRGYVEGEILSTLDLLRWEKQEYHLKTGKRDYLKTLDKLIDTYKANPVCAEVYLEKATNSKNYGKSVEALAFLNDAIARYPGYKRIGALKALKEEILLPALIVATDKTVYPNTMLPLRVTHLNLDRFTIHLYRVNLPATSPLLKETIDSDFCKKYARKVLSKEFTLTRSNDYSHRDTLLEVKAPAEGLYVLQIASEAAKGVSEESLLAVSSIKSLARKLPNNQLEVLVVDAQSGKPVGNANVCLLENRKGEYVEVLKQPTNTEGKLLTDWDERFNYITVETASGEKTRPEHLYPGHYHYGENSNSSESIQLLTDRSVYRPGQTVYVKGIAYQRQKQSATVLPGKSYKLALRDANGREVSVKTVKSNEFGSFTAEFSLPTGGLNGVYYLETENGNTTIRVEEYKRPTFDITFAKQAGSYHLGDSIRVKGEVKTFSGVSMQEQSVAYVVRRSYNAWWRGSTYSGDQIASGTVLSDADGKFEIPVHLTEIAGRNADDWGVYSYTVEASVTNEGGETQTSSTQINVADRSFALSSNLADKVSKDTPIEVIVKAENLDYQEVAAKGTYKIYRYSDYLNRKLEKEAMISGTFIANQKTILTGLQDLPSGGYAIKFSTTDEQGREVKSENSFILFSLADTRPPVEQNIWLHQITTTFDKETPALFTFGTSLEDVCVWMDVFSGNQRLESKILNLSNSIMKFEYPYQDSYGDGLTIVFCFVKAGEIHQQSVHLAKKQPTRELKLSWNVFRDKLRPGQQEEWKLTITDPQGAFADAELLATMYDASLDKIWKRNQTFRVNYPITLPYANWATVYKGGLYYHLQFDRTKTYYPEAMNFDSFFMVAAEQSERVLFRSKRSKVRGGYSTESSAALGYSGLMDEVVVEHALVGAPNDLIEFEAGGQGETLDNFQNVRTNFAETAFFYPQLRTNAQGEVVVAFTMPESLTRWNFCGYAHTKDMLTGMIESTATTSKEFMLTPNLPRFVRVGDQTSVAASVINLTEKAVSGTVVFTLFNPITEKVISTQKQNFKAEAGKTGAVNFMFTATDKYELLGCRITAQGGNFSDGEQHLLPVLSNKENIIEAISIPVRGNEICEVYLQSLFNNNSKTATDRRLTIEFAGNPVWYAVQSLPALALPTNDNAISWATAYYANSLASYIANAQPKIKAIFDAWREQGGTKESFLTNLEKNQDVKNILLAESPWLMEATSETERMHRIATLFDLNNVRSNNITAQNKLKELQLTDGSWSWYKGMQGSTYITNFVVETLARLSQLTGKTPDRDMLNMQQEALEFLHKEALREYKSMLKAEKNGSKVKGISGSALRYMYLVSLSDKKVPADNQNAYQYFLNKLPESIANLSLTEKAHAAVVLRKAGKTAEAQEFIASLKEHAVQTDEMGMHFAFNENPYSWLNLKVPAHVAVMEAMDKVANDTKAVEEMKLWLLKQKQTQQWDSPVSTVNAIYALLHRGSDLLANQGNARITLGGKTIDTQTPSASSIPGLAYVKETFTDKAFLSKIYKVAVEKQDDGIAWGAIYQQYKEDIDKVNRRQGSELNVDKKLYVEKVTGAKKELFPVTADTRLAVGDKVVSRITIRLDRAMDFVQLKDQRAACFEPIGNLSGYIRQNGVGYYVAVKDASTNFFFDSLGKGVYVLEHSYRVSRAGTYESGLATMQSAYSPEFTSHSASVKVKVDK